MNRKSYNFSFNGRVPTPNDFKSIAFDGENQWVSECSLNGIVTEVRFSFLPTQDHLEVIEYVASNWDALIIDAFNSGAVAGVELQDAIDDACLTFKPSSVKAWEIEIQQAESNGICISVMTAITDREFQPNSVDSEVCPIVLLIGTVSVATNSVTWIDSERIFDLET
ncbi:MAG: hypothetical protein AAF802_24370 [Planctomycetota bacterium]